MSMAEQGQADDQWVTRVLFTRLIHQSWPCIITSLAEQTFIGVIGNKKGSIYQLHTAGVGEAPHQPVVDALQIVGVH